MSLKWGIYVFFLVFLLPCYSVEVCCDDIERAHTDAMLRAYDRLARPNAMLSPYTSVDHYVIQELCQQVPIKPSSFGNPSEQWMCTAWGRRLSDFLYRWGPQVRFSRKDIQRSVTHITQDSVVPNVEQRPGALWVRIVAGNVARFRVYSHETLREEERSAAAEILSFVVLSSRKGAFSESHTFELLFLLGGGDCKGDPYAFHGRGRYWGYNGVPLLSPSKGGRCEYHVAVPGGWGSQVGSSEGEWGSLQGIQVGGNEDVQNALRLVALRHLGLIEHEVRMKCPEEELCVSTLKELIHLKQLPDFNVVGLCAERAGFCLPENGVAAQYIVSFDRKGLSEAIQRPGTALWVANDSAEAVELYDTADLHPFIHYVPVAGVGEVNGTLDWLKRNPGVAERIASVGSLYTKRHGTIRGKIRFLQVFAALYASRWVENSPPDSAPEPFRNEPYNTFDAVSCKNLQEVVNALVEKGADTFFANACGVPAAFPHLYPARTTDGPGLVLRGGYETVPEQPDLPEEVPYDIPRSRIGELYELYEAVGVGWVGVVEPDKGSGGSESDDDDDDGGDAAGIWTARICSMFPALFAHLAKAKKAVTVALFYAFAVQVLYL